MKVLFVCAAGLVGGKERQTLEFMIALRDRQHDVFCVTSAWTTGEFEELLRRAMIPYAPLRLGFITTPRNWSSFRMTFDQLIHIPSLYWNYRRLIRKWDPCVVVHSNYQHVLMLMPLLKSKPQVFHVHDVFANTSFFQKLLRRFDSRISKFIGVSKHVCERIKQLGIKEEKIELVYNGIRPPADTQRTSKNIPVIGIAGQIGSWKGHEVLLKALSLIREVPWQLHVIGFGAVEYINQLRTISKEYNIGDRVEFKGKVEGLMNIYRGIDIACVPSTVSESFGLAAAEPGFFGIPTVVSNLGGLPEIIVDGKTGFVVPVGDVENLSGALHQLLIDPGKRKQFGDAARERVNSLFTVENNVVKMESVLNELCRK